MLSIIDFIDCPGRVLNHRLGDLRVAGAGTLVLGAKV